PEPEPIPLELGTAPALPPGVDVVPPALEPLPLVMPSSFRHFSRSEPVMPRHLLLVLPEAAPLVLGELALGEALLGELVLGELVLGELVLGEPLAPAELLPDAPEEPGVCASETLDRAKSAAAVAALMSFSVISVFPPYLGVPEELPLLPEPLLPEPMPEPLPVPGVLVVLLPDAPPLELLPLEVLLPLAPLVPPLEAAPDLL